MSGVDRFGDHGVVGVLALDAIERRVVLVSVSCRVLALCPCAVFVSEVLRVSKVLDLNRPPASSTVDDAPVPTVLARAHLAFTPRNSPCRSLFSDLGFIQVFPNSADSNLLRVDCASVPVDTAQSAAAKCRRGG